MVLETIDRRTGCKFGTEAGKILELNPDVKTSRFPFVTRVNTVGRCLTREDRKYLVTGTGITDTGMDNITDCLSCLPFVRFV